jgi:hypothetical protein
MKFIHFIPVKMIYTGPQLVEHYLSRIVCPHDKLKNIMFDRGTHSTSKILERLHESMDIKLNFSLVYHPKIDG